MWEGIWGKSGCFPKSCVEWQAQDEAGSAKEPKKPTEPLGYRAKHGIRNIIDNLGVRAHK